jgi:hypothetical protein
MNHYCALDLGKLHDFSCLAVDRLNGTKHEIIHCGRFRKGTPYAKVVKRTIELVSKLPGDKMLCVDYGGIGVMASEGFSGAPFPVVNFLFTGGRMPSYEGSHWHIPKFMVFSVANTEISEGRVGIAGNIRDSAGLIREMGGYVMKMSSGGTATFSNAPDVGFDDRVTSLCTAIYAAVREGVGEPGLTLEQCGIPLSFGRLIDDEHTPASDAYMFQRGTCEEIARYLEGD